MASKQTNTYVGFGFGAIQSGLFLCEAYQADPQRRLVVSEVVPDVVAAIRGARGECAINVAQADGIVQVRIENIEIQNPAEVEDRKKLVAAVAEASEIATAVPSVNFYTSDNDTCISHILADGLIKKIEQDGPMAVIYTAENNNHAAELLEEAVYKLIPEDKKAAVKSKVQILNTVIGKMCQVVADPETIQSRQLAPVTPGGERAFLVEAFNRILITRIRLGGDFKRGISVFEEKDDLLPFEEAKLYGHNATHALIGYLGAMAGATYMAEIPVEAQILVLAEEAFLQESGGALIKKYAGSDELFTKAGYREYVRDLIVRMTNPYLKDAIQRVTRDSQRKLGWNDRLIGTMRLAMRQGIQPRCYACGAAAALVMLDGSVLQNPGKIDGMMDEIWTGMKVDEREKQSVLVQVKAALAQLDKWRQNEYKELDKFVA